MEKYIHYTDVDFATEPSFIRWAKQQSKPDDFNWDQFVVSHADKKQAIDKARKLIQSINVDHEDVNQEAQERVWNKVMASVSTGTATVRSLESEPPKKSKVIRLLAVVASTAAIVLLTFNFLNTDFDKVTTSYAEQKSVDLPDESIVKMNAGSTLKVYKDEWAKERVINLDGEAFFEVEKGNSFIVETAVGNVEVLGTSFNVFARGDKFSVYCASGKVRVNSPGQKETTLLPGQSVIIQNEQYKFWEKTPKNIATDNWLNGEYVYNAAPLDDVIRELSRQFDVKIKIDKQFSGKYYTGDFSNKDLDTALMKVFWPLNLDYTIKGKNIEIRSK